MSEKRLDAKNRWRNVVVAFRMSPEEAQELNVKVSLSGLSKQDYIIQCLLKHEIRVVGGMKVAKKVQVHLDTILEELYNFNNANIISFESGVKSLNDYDCKELVEESFNLAVIEKVDSKSFVEQFYKKMGINYVLETESI